VGTESELCSTAEHAPSRLLLPVEDIVRELNVFLRGWAGYFRHGDSARAPGQIRNHALVRLGLFVAKRHQHQGN
jgi:RNA-directed DNA polymerase